METRSLLRQTPLLAILGVVLLAVAIYTAVAGVSETAKAMDLAAQGRPYGDGSGYLGIAVGVAALGAFLLGFAIRRNPQD